MEFFDVIQKRSSVRSYKPSLVEPEKLQQILEAARLAPTACNLQAFKIVVVKTEQHKDEIKKIYPKEWFSDAPYIIGICSIRNEGYVRKDKKDFSDIDAAIVMDHIILSATALGLGTCWIGAFNPEAAKEILGLDENLEPVVFTPLGYPGEPKVFRKRKALEELVISIE